MRQWYGSVNRLFTRIAAIVIAAVLAIWIFTGYYGIPMCVFFAGVMASITGFISTRPYLDGIFTSSAEIRGGKSFGN